MCITKRSIAKLAVCSVAILSVGLMSCAAPTRSVATADTMSGPVAGPVILNTVLPIKDYDVLGMIFVRSEVRVDRVSQSREVRSGSPVTFEMLMLEAQKLGADDIMNIRTDLYVTETRNNYGRVTSTVYTHAATAVAIKYTDVVSCDFRTITPPQRFERGQRQQQHPQHRQQTGAQPAPAPTPATPMQANPQFQSPAPIPQGIE